MSAEAGTTLRIHRLLMGSRVDGPGLRAVVWVQGCPLRCRGCGVPQTWDPEGGFSRDVDELADDILTCEGLEGLSLLGGEPFAQADACANG